MKTFLFSGLTFSLLCISFLCFSQTKQDTITIRQFLRSAESFKNSNVDSMLFFNAKAIGFSQKVHNEKYLSFAYQQLASYYFEKDNFEKSTEYFLRALKIDEGRKDTYRIAELNGELSEIYYKLEKFEKAMGYLETALKLYRSISDSMNIARMYCHIGKLHGAREYCETRSVEQKRIDYTTAIDYLNKCLDICLRHDWQEGVCNAYLNLASVYNRFNMSKQALVYVLRTYDYYKKRNDLDGISNTLFNLAITYRKLKQYSKAIDYYKETIAFGKKHNMTGGIQFVYEELAQAYYEAGDYKNSRDYYVQYMIARDSTYTLEKSKQIFELETQYQTEKKEKQILALTLEKERKQRNFYIILSGIFIAALGAAYYVLRTRSRATIAEKNNHINEQKIDQMEKERQLIAVHAVLHGEETERTRLARDLHDGLGGLLSGLKLSLTKMKGNVFVTSENVEAFNQALELLDTSIKELRRVAHNMMPAALTKFGLKEALTDFCSGLFNPDIDIKFHFYGTEARLEQNYEINIYRIAMELMNNAMKHARASEIILMIVQEECRIHLTVQDNGIGFDPRIVSTSSGMGFANIRSRVESLNGKMEVTSESDKGTEIGIEIAIL